MKTFKQIKVPALLLLVGICPPLLAKDYIVEMIFFADKHEASSNSSQVFTGPVMPDTRGAILLNDDGLLHDFIPYPPETLTLVNQATALVESGRYKILQHVAWLQPGLTKEEAIAVRIHAGKDYSNEFKDRPSAQTDSGETNVINQSLHELDGTVKVVLGRYLHVYTDLVYRLPHSMDATSTTNSLDHSPVLANFAIKTHRKMRGKELHYLDHPLLGILVEIRPVELEQKNQ